MKTNVKGWCKEHKKGIAKGIGVAVGSTVMAGAAYYVGWRLGHNDAEKNMIHNLTAMQKIGLLHCFTPEHDETDIVGMIRTIERKLAEER